MHLYHLKNQEFITHFYYELLIKCMGFDAYSTTHHNMQVCFGPAQIERAPGEALPWLDLESGVAQVTIKRQLHCIL